MKQHLAGIRGAIAPCKKVPYDMRFQIGEYLKGVAEKNKETRQLHNEENIHDIDLSRDEGNMEEDGKDDFKEIPSGSRSRSESGSATRLPPTQGDPSSRKRKGDPSLTNYFAPRTTPGAQIY